MLHILDDGIIMVTVQNIKQEIAFPTCFNCTNFNSAQLKPYWHAVSLGRHMLGFTFIIICFKNFESHSVGSPLFHIVVINYYCTIT